MQSCNPVNEDCACKDITYEFCKEPTANQELHVNSIKDCIDNCDVSISFLIYYMISSNLQILSISSLPILDNVTTFFTMVIMVKMKTAN